MFDCKIDEEWVLSDIFAIIISFEISNRMCYNKYLSNKPDRKAKNICHLYTPQQLTSARF